MNSSNHFSVRNLLWKACLLATAMSLVGVTVALAASGSLDTTFSGDGKVIMDIVAGQSSQANAVAIQPDGKIVVVGNTWPVLWDNSNIAITRFTKSGALDTTFNGTGKRVVDFGANSDDEAYSVVINSANGKIIVSGYIWNTAVNYQSIFVFRFNSNGSWDTTFNGTGKFLDNFALHGGGSLGGLALQPDGKIVVAARTYNPTDLTDFVVYRLTSTGVLDKTFNGSGRQTIAFGAGRNDTAQALAYSPSTGKIVVTGETCDSSYRNCNFAVARLNPNGALDTTFSADGKQITDFGGDDHALGLALQGGKPVVVGYKTISDTQGYTALARYNNYGSLDTTFAGTGKKLLNVGGQLDSLASAVNIQASTGKIITCGHARGKFALVRLTASGALDTTFHSTGMDIVDITGMCYAMATQPADGKYVVAGASIDSGSRHWAVARVLP